MDIHINDILVMKKPHPCGEKRWMVLRTGADFRLRCLGCGHEVMTPRFKAEKNVRTIEHPSAPIEGVFYPLCHFATAPPKWEPRDVPLCSILPELAAGPDFGCDELFARTKLYWCHPDWEAGRWRCIWIL